MHGNTLE